MSFLFSHIDAINHSIKQIFKQPLHGILNIIVFSLSIGLPLLFLIIVDNVSKYSTSLSSDPQISLFLSKNISQKSVSNLEDILKKSPQVSQYTFISKQTALANFQARDDLRDLIMSIEDNPLPDAFIVRPSSTDPKIIEQFEKEASNFEGVEEIQVDSDWLRKLHVFLTISRITLLLLTILLATSLVVIVFNTIRLQILIQQKEIEISKLIGATNSFIRRPFLYFGAFQGFIGGCGALFLNWGFLALFNHYLDKLAMLYNSILIISGPSPRQILVVLAIGLTLGWMGAWVASSKHLKNLEYQ